MKYTLLALTAATALSGAAASRHHRRHNHAEIFKRYGSDSYGSDSSCSCTTYVTSRVVAVTVYPTKEAVVYPTKEAVSYPSKEAPGYPSKEAVTYPTKEAVPAYPTKEAPSKEAATYPSEEAVTTTIPHTLTSTTTTVVTSTGYTLPTPMISTCSTPGVYTIPGATVTLTKTQTVPVAPNKYAVHTPGVYTRPEVITTVTATSQVISCPYETSTPVSSYTPEAYHKPEAYHTPAAEYTPEAYHKPKAYHTPPAAYTPKTYHTPSVVPKPSSAVYKPSSKTYAGAPSVILKPSSAVYKPSSKTYTSVPSVVPKPSSAVYKPSSKTYASTPSSHPQPVSGGKQWSIAYSPYNDDHSCKSASDVDSDIKDIASRGFSNVRIYATDCNGLPNVSNACSKYGMGIIVGIFIKAGGTSTGDQDVANLIRWKKWPLVRAVIVGNEAVFNGYCSAPQLASYITSVRSKLSGAGYNGPVTTTETLNILQANGAALCPVMDFVGVNVQPYFDGGVTAEKAGGFVASQLKLAEGVCHGKSGYVMESGWPTGGAPIGAAIPGVSQQATALKGIEKYNPGKVSYFTYTNDGWKSPSSNGGIETKFGCGDAFGVVKNL